MKFQYAHHIRSLATVADIFLGSRGAPLVAERRNREAAHDNLLRKLCSEYTKRKAKNLKIFTLLFLLAVNFGICD